MMFMVPWADAQAPQPKQDRVTLKSITGATDPLVSTATFTYHIKILKGKGKDVHFFPPPNQRRSKPAGTVTGISKLTQDNDENITGSGPPLNGWVPVGGKVQFTSGKGKTTTRYGINFLAKGTTSQAMGPGLYEMTVDVPKKKGKGGFVDPRVGIGRWYVTSDGKGYVNAKLSSQNNNVIMQYDGEKDRTPIIIPFLEDNIQAVVSATNHTPVDKIQAGGTLTLKVELIEGNVPYLVVFGTNELNPASCFIGASLEVAHGPLFMASLLPGVIRGGLGVVNEAGEAFAELNIPNALTGITLHIQTFFVTHQGGNSTFPIEVNVTK
ncbi:MAG: hypothetical protein ISS93_00660 [Candidatus Aenigmarchaeota archaeon]|nr:hypothetical protein [Candidatus Aenigmarchaeota archaeon]